MSDLDDLWGNSAGDWGDAITSDDVFESADTLPDPIAIRRHAKHRMLSALKKEKAHTLLKALPDSGESVHIVSNGSFDYFSFCQVILDLLPSRRSQHFYGSTWTMNRTNVIDLFDLFDSGRIGSLDILTGVYFKRRESAVYATLLNGIIDRNQRYLALRNHCKLMLFDDPDSETYITMEGSANFTANPRIEQTTITNDYALWRFHADWIEGVLSNAKRKKETD